MTWQQYHPEELTQRNIVVLQDPVVPEGKQIATQTFNGEGEQPTWDLTYLDLVTVRVPQEVFDYQFAGEAEARGIITREECDAWVGPGTVPEKLVEAIKQIIPDDEARRPIELFLMGSKQFPRYHPNTEALAPLFGLTTAAEIDAFFISARKR